MPPEDEENECPKKEDSLAHLPPRYNIGSKRKIRKRPLAEETQKTDKLYKADYVGSGTFIISKPKRKKAKARQSRLKNVARGSRK